MILVGSDFSGVGAFDQALKRLGINYKTAFACDMDKYARQTFIANYGQPDYYPENVYNREIPESPLDIYMTSPPCQAFSLAGKRKGEYDERGVLFYNSHEFIVKNKPRFFIFENVKGLLSDAKGRTFQIWLDMLGGKTVNGSPVLFPREDATPYHIYHKVLNAKHYGVPQNRERVFIVGIRDDADNFFRWPKAIPLNKRLKDILQDQVDEKYFLSDSAIESIILNENNLQKSKVNPDIANALQTPGNACGVYKGMTAISCGAIRGRGVDGKISQRLEYSQEDYSNSITTVQKDNVVIQLNQGRESGGIQPYQQDRVYDKGGISPAILANLGRGHSINTPRIRRLTPRECFRLMDFPEDFIMPCSDTQMYKQAGNSIVVAVLAGIINQLKL